MYLSLWALQNYKWIISRQPSIGRVDFIFNHFLFHDKVEAFRRFISTVNKVLDRLTRRTDLNDTVPFFLYFSAVLSF